MNGGGHARRGGLWLGWAACLMWVCASVTSADAAADEPSDMSEWLGIAARLHADLEGVFSPVENRPVVWRLTWTEADAGRRRGEVVASGEGLELRIVLDVGVADGLGTWRVIAGKVDVGGWTKALQQHSSLGATLAGLGVVGDAELSGAGYLGGDGTMLRGELWLTIADATVRNADEGWTLTGVGVRAGGDVDELLRGNVDVALSVGNIATTRFGARSLAATGRVVDWARIEVASAQVEIAGGEVKARPFRYVFATPALDVTFAMRRVGLQDLVVFMPETFSDARGRVDGTLRLTWSPDAGVEVGAGELAVEKSEPTVVRLAANPGFLTESVPARFTFLSEKWGWLSRLFSARNEAYDALSEIERGKLALRVERMEVRLTPEGDERGRTASVLLSARPEQGGTAVGEVTFEVNVSGPLADILRIGVAGGKLSTRAR